MLLTPAARAPSAQLGTWNPRHANGSVAASSVRRTKSCWSSNTVGAATRRVLKPTTLRSSGQCRYAYLPEGKITPSALGCWRRHGSRFKSHIGSVVNRTRNSIYTLNRVIETALTSAAQSTGMRKMPSSKV
eukprot:4938257-Pyramimonas_sp.AAC.2